MPKFSRIFRILIDRGTDFVFEHISTSGKEKTVSLPPRLRKFEVGAAELLARSEELLGRAAGSLGVGEEEGVREFNIEYCLECCDKHVGGSSKILEEAMTFYDRDGFMSERVQNKVRAVVKEMAGMYDDIPRESPPRVRRVLDRSDEIRKSIWNKGLELGLGKRDDLAEIKAEVDGLRDYVFDVAKEEIGGGSVKYCAEWGAKDLGECAELWRRARREEGFEEGISQKEFEDRLSRLTGKKFETKWDDKGRLMKIKVK